MGPMAIGLWRPIHVSIHLRVHFLISYMPEVHFFDIINNKIDASGVKRLIPCMSFCS